MIVLVATGVAASTASLAFLPVPFAGFFLAWAFVLASLAGRSRRLRSTLVLLAIVALVMGAAELLLDLFPTRSVWRSRREKVVNGDPNLSSNLRDEVLGYAPRKPSTIDTTEYFDGEPIYTVRYTIDEQGLRLSNPADRPAGGPCLLFFGGSDVYGVGLDDADTLPWQVGELSGLRIINLAYGGWGPHQMLSAWDNGLVDQVVDCEVRGAFYLTVGDHIARAAGKRFWDRHGPRYELQDDGEAVLAGHFDDDGLAAFVWKWSNRSRIVRNVLPKRSPTQADFELFSAIVAGSRAHVQRISPESDLHVLIWPNDWLAEMEERFDALGIPHHRIADRLPAYEEDKARYRIHEHDSHPNRLANNLIAEYIVREILSTPDRAAQSGVVPREESRRAARQ